MNEWRGAIEKSLSWMEDNITEKFTLLDLANQAGYSPFYFSRLFRFITGMTVKKYIADRRLCRAALDIRDTRERLIDIAVRYGFSSQEALTRALKAAYGHTPYALRKNPYLIVLPAQTVDSLLDNIHQKRGYSMNDYLEKSKEILDDFTKTTGFSRKFVGINIVSSNPERLAGFYEKALGAHIVNDKAHGGPNRIEIWFGERNENTTWITVNYDEGFKPQVYHACQGFEFRVADADAEYKRMTELGIEVKEPPKDLPWGYRYFNIQDPDGNGIDIVAAL
ncbi:MAG: AraC family transcriptional regulator [Oscillospiraceae bacterium]|nr:AraC family transcriptional regulator [Oscillospiraceae bacterium]